MLWQLIAEPALLGLELRHTGEQIDRDQGPADEQRDTGADSDRRQHG